MDGAKLKLTMLDFLDELTEDDLYAFARKMYDCLDLAAGIYARETLSLHAEEEITTVADQQAYDLPTGYVSLSMKNRRDRFFIKYYDGSNYSFPIFDSWDRIYKSNLTDSKEWPNKFTIRDKPAKEELITGTTTAAGAASGGQCTLTDTSKAFTTTDRVYPRDIVHNTSDGSTGYVLSVTDANNLVTALFAGTDDDWTSGDGYVIQPAAEKQIFLDAPSQTAGHTIYVPYATTPSPVFSDYGFWRISPRSCRGICAGAASIFKMPKREFTESRQIGGLFAAEIERARREIARMRVHARR